MFDWLRQKFERDEKMYTPDVTEKEVPFNRRQRRNVIRHLPVRSMRLNYFGKRLPHRRGNNRQIARYLRTLATEQANES